MYVVLRGGSRGGDRSAARRGVRDMSFPSFIVSLMAKNPKIYVFEAS